MTRQKHILIGLVVGAGLLLLIIGAAYAQAGGLNLPWWTVDGGGGEASAAGYQLRGSIGQADAGAMSGPGYQLSGGFWAGGLPAAQPRAMYLPVVRR